MLTCDKCGEPKTTMVRVKDFLGTDGDWGNQYHETWRCVPCLLKGLMVEQHEPHCVFEQPPRVKYIGIQDNKPEYRLEEDLTPKKLGELRCTCRIAPGRTMAECYESKNH